jgi:NAD(P)-dependent dehydrogenase (short-subunit alcohol dehydrogenase family)
MRFGGKVVMVTGAASRIVLPTAQRFGSGGARVVVADLAAVIAFPASEEARFVQGAALVVDGGRLGRL